MKDYYLVMYDIIPGGTGYLAKLYNTDEFSNMLMLAYDKIKDCTCQLEGKTACYRCILTYGNQYSRDSFSREQAEILFGKLVGGSKSWERIEGSVGTIAQNGAAEDSELELKFVRALQTLAKSNNWSFEKVADDNAYHYELKIVNKDSDTEIHYYIKPQFELTVAYGVKHNTIPDFQFMCIFAKINGEEISDLVKIPWWSVFLDGYQFHACEPNMRFYSDWEKREGIKQAKPQRMFSWTIAWEDIQLFETEREDELGNNSVTRFGQLLEKSMLGSIKETCYWCIYDSPNFLSNGGSLYSGSVEIVPDCDVDLTDYSTDDEVEEAYSQGVKYDLQIIRGLKSIDKDEWIGFWRRYNLIQFFSCHQSETIDNSVEDNVDRDVIKELYPGMEDIVDILLDNNVPFSHDGVFELTDEDNAVIASAAMIIDNPKIAIDPFGDNDKTVFTDKGYKTISQEEFCVELIK